VEFRAIVKTSIGQTDKVIRGNGAFAASSFRMIVPVVVVMVAI